MLDEPSIFSGPEAHTPPPPEVSEVTPPGDEVLQALEQAVKLVMAVDKVDTTPPAPIKARFTGRLQVDSEAAFTSWIPPSPPWTTTPC